MPYLTINVTANLVYRTCGGGFALQPPGGGSDEFRERGGGGWSPHGNLGGGGGRFVNRIPQGGSGRGKGGSWRQGGDGRIRERLEESFGEERFPRRQGLGGRIRERLGFEERSQRGFGGRRQEFRQRSGNVKSSGPRQPLRQRARVQQALQQFEERRSSYGRGGEGGGFRERIRERFEDEPQRGFRRGRIEEFRRRAQGSTKSSGPRQPLRQRPRVQQALQQFEERRSSYGRGNRRGSSFRGNRRGSSFRLRGRYHPLRQRIRAQQAFGQFEERRSSVGEGGFGRGGFGGEGFRRYRPQDNVKSSGPRQSLRQRPLVQQALQQFEERRSSFGGRSFGREGFGGGGFRRGSHRPRLQQAFQQFRGGPSFSVGKSSGGGGMMMMTHEQQRQMTLTAVRSGNIPEFLKSRIQSFCQTMRSHGQFRDKDRITWRNCCDGFLDQTGNMDEAMGIVMANGGD
ncbi:uncharacterized protein LOC135924323 [Gordionus sp. m RMFG-2023]|uniref:uncharacterized protein LOC135924323 n=1 Tax=Gordionus sp. m RMFG-2023 TaxID=3053472 RepID=UPI0031FCD182